ncbi:hypothetical protein [Providencia rettgeri]|uniref:hypothetical protein n=1 Tax=Providencia rettgeri TaxID=587 RepID=UPI001BA7C9D6|nr:hypothetical protein [Providencia rettgeri]MBS0921786.1 hypothetical protein [Providencia rettgeri]
MNIDRLKYFIEIKNNNSIINNKKSFSYNIKEKPINTNCVSLLKMKFEKIDTNTKNLKNTHKNKAQNLIKKETLEYDISAFKNDLMKKNLYFIYSSPKSKKIELIHNHNENKINSENAIFINMFDLLKNEPDGSIYKINNYIIKITNKNKKLTINDNRFTHNITLKNGKDILIERYNKKSKFSF